MPLLLSCNQCGQQFQVPPYRKNSAKYCSQRCYGKAIRGHTPWMKGRHHSEETRKKLSASHMGHIPWNKGISCSEETKRKLSNCLKGRSAWNKGKTIKTDPRILSGKTHPMYNKQHSRASRKKMSESHKGQRSSPSTEFKKGHKTWNKGLRGKASHCYGRQLTLKTKDKISNSQKGRHYNPQTEFKKGHPPFGSRKGGIKHRKFVKKIADIVNTGINKVEIEKTVCVNGKGHIIDVLVDDTLCFEIGTCKHKKIRELETNGFLVVHLPYPFLEDIQL